MHDQPVDFHRISTAMEVWSQVKSAVWFHIKEGTRENKSKFWMISSGLKQMGTATTEEDAQREADRLNAAFAQAHDAATNFVLNEISDELAKAQKES